MTRTAKISKAEARRAAEAVAQTIAEAFNLTAPPAVSDLYEGNGNPRDWSFTSETVTVWTDYGPARCNVSISPRLVHLYFQFDDVDRAAAGLWYRAQDLNRHSGKWNLCERSDRDALPEVQRMICASLEAVADPCPPTWEVIEHDRRKAAEAAEWAAMREEMNTGIDRPDTTARKLEYIEQERARFTRARRLEQSDRQGWHALGLHPHTPAEVAARFDTLDKMEAEARARMQPTESAAA